VAAVNPTDMKNTGCCIRFLNSVILTLITQHNILMNTHCLSIRATTFLQLQNCNSISTRATERQTKW
jgi:hypothetical protein